MYSIKKDMVKLYHYMKQKILLICTDSNSVINFRKELIIYLQQNDFDIEIIAGDDKRENEISKLNVGFHCVPFSNRSTNILKDIKLKRNIAKAIKKINPDIVFTFQIKPNILGVKAAHKCRVKSIFSMIEGLGDPFQPHNLKGRILRSLISLLYKESLKHTKKVFLLNSEDKEECISRHIIKREQAIVIPSIGINMAEYTPASCLPKEKKIIYMARLIKNKGIIDYCEVARKVHIARPDIVFELYGSETEQINKKTLSPYINDGSINYKGFVTDTIATINSARIYVSFSYREGFPRTFLECAALKKPIIATDVIGNKEGVINNETGYLLPIHDINAFTNKIIEVIDDDELLIQLGENAYKFCEARFQSQDVNKIIYDALLEK